MTVKWMVGLTLATLIGATPLGAQARGWAPPKCDLKPGHFLVNSGVLYLKNATETRFEDQKRKDLQDALRVLTEAITTRGQDKNAAAWYYLGRYYQMIVPPNLAGADSAFTRAQALVPSCKDDIALWRRVIWTPIFNKGVQAFNAGQTDSAISYFRQANLIFAGEPGGQNALATLYANQGQVDSAAKYYGLAAQAAATDTVKYAKERREALYNRGAVLHQAKRWDDALAAFREYLAAYPTDLQALSGVASAYAGKGEMDSATVMYLRIVERADSVPPEQLFTAGVAIFNGAPPQPDTSAAGNSCRTEARRDRTLTPRRIAVRCDSVTRALVREHDRTAAGTYRLAARAFEAGLTRNPGYRDALYNLANTYLVLEDSAKLLPVAQRLVTADPMNRNVLRLTAAGWQLRGKPDSTLHYLTEADSLLPVDVTVTNFSPQDQSASWSALATNFHDKPSAPLKLTVEFLDAKGEVVASQSVDVAAIEPGGTGSLQASAIGAGIVAWRYKKG